MKNNKNEILFIDSSVTNAPSIIASIASFNTQVVLLDGKSDALSQIVSTLNGQKNLDAIHIISHGRAGELRFANGTLDNDNLSNYTQQLNKIGQSLSLDGDLLLYGCDVAQGDEGESFINSIAKLTQADVAASNNLTGATALNGDWNLEVHSGTVNSTSFSLTNYKNVLGTPPDLISGLGGTSGFGENDYVHKDDPLQSPGIDITSVFGASGVKFGANYYTQLFINNNGMVTFGAATSAYTPNGLSAGVAKPGASSTYLPTIALYWTDLDTRYGSGSTASNTVTPSAGGTSQGTNLVHWDLDTVNKRMIITWDDVAEYKSTQSSTPVLAGQIILTDAGSGNMNIEFRYEYVAQLANHTATAGWNVGKAGGVAGVDYYEIPATGTLGATNALSDLDTNVGNSSQTGDFQFYLVNGGVVNKALNYDITTFVGDLTGAIATTATITLLGDTFVGAIGAVLGSVTNVPVGLTAVLVKASDTTATLSLTGNATNHTNANDISNLTVTFSNADFSGGAASSVTGATKSNLIVDFPNITPSFTGGTNEGLTLLEDAAITTITTAMLEVKDPEQTPAQLTYTITVIPTKGTLTNNGVTVNVGSTFTQADINNGTLQYKPSANLDGPDSFSFDIFDGISTLSGQVFNFAITSVNDIHTGIPSFSGTLTLGSTLTAGVGSLSDIDGSGSISWQWQISSDNSSWGDISGATSSTYVLTSSELGQYVRVKANWGSGSFAESEVSSSSSISPNFAAITASPTVSEPVSLPTTVNASGAAVNVFDFTINDGVTDTLPTTVSQIVLNTSGSADFSKVTWLLNGTDISSSVTGVYNSGTNTITFSGLGISVADTTNETYTVSAYYNNNTGLTEGQTYVLSLSPNSGTSIGLTGSSTQWQLAQPAVTNGTGSTVDVTATELRFNAQPAGSVSGFALTTQPTLIATDSAGNIDINFNSTVSVTESSSGNLSGTTSVSASAGTVNFSGVTYNATTDHESFQLSASSGGVTGVTSNSVNSDVVATKLEFSTQPVPTTIESGRVISFSATPSVRAIDAQNILDVDYSAAVVLAATNSVGGAVAGSVTNLTSTSDTDSNTATATQNASSGTTSFSGLTLQYTNANASDTLAFKATSGGLTPASSDLILSNRVPLVSAISYGSTSPTNASSVNYTVTFTETVTGVNVNDFKLTTSGSITGASISSISGSGLTYTIAINTGSGDGSIRLDLDDDDSILSVTNVPLGNVGIGNGNFSTGQAYILDRTAPSIVIDTIAGDDKIDTQEDDNAIAITGSTLGVEDSQTLTVNIGGLIKTATVTSNLWNVVLAASEVQSLPDGTINITANVSDAVGNAAPQASKSVIYNKTPPTSVITSSDYVISSGETATIQFVFSEAVTDFTTSDVTVANGSITSPFSSDGGLTWTATFTPTANIENPANVITVNNTGVRDNVGNSGIDVTTSPNYSIDTLSPTILSIVRQNPPTEPTNADSLTYRMTFSEIVQNLDTSDFAVTGTTATISNVNAIDSSTYDVTVSGGDLASLNGTAFLTFVGSQNITDNVNNPLFNATPTGTNNVSYLLDNFANPLTLTLISDSGSNGTDAITNNSNVNVSGIDSGATWEFSSDNGSNWNAGTGTQFALTGDGNKSVIARQTDSLGNLSANSGALNFTLDTTVVSPSVSLFIDTGNNSSDSITNNGNLVVSGLESSATWEFSYDGTNWTTGSGNSFTVSPDGNYAIVVRQTDVAGNLSASSAAFNFTLDGLIATPDLTLMTDSGQNGDSITNQGIVNVSGLETGAIWNYSLDGGANWTQGTGNSLTLSGDGNQSVLIQQTDIAGNTSANSSALNFMLDSKVATPSLALAIDSGLANDNITNQNKINVSGIETGASWEFSTDGTNWFAGSGDYFTVLGDGNYAVFVRQTDIAGNLSASSAAFNFTLDSIIATPNLALATDSGKNNDNITNDGIVNVSGLETGANWNYSLDGGTNWTAGTGNNLTLSGDGNKSLLVRQTDVAGNLSNNTFLNVILDTTVAIPILSLAIDSGQNNDKITHNGTVNVSGIEAGASWEFSTDGSNWTTGSGNSFTVLTDGNYAVFVRQIDVAGNASASSSAFNFTLDKTVAQPSLELANDSGNHTDSVTNDGTINVSGLESGASWNYSVDGGTTWTTGTGSNLVLVGDGNKSVLVRQTDVAGNTSTNTAINFTLDSTIATPSLTLAVDSGRNNDKITNVGTVNVSGLEAGASWEFSADGSNWFMGSGHSFTVTNDNNYAVFVRQTDVAGNVSTVSSALNFTLDSAITAPVLALGTINGVSKIGTISVSGIENNATWQYSLDYGNTWSSGTGNSFTLNGDGNKNVIVRQTDVAGNVSPSSALTFTLDTAAIIPVLELASDTGKNNTDHITRNGTVSVSGLEDGANWEFSTDGVSWNEGIGQSFGVSDDGNQTVFVHQIDTVGNISPNSLLLFTLDTQVNAPTLSLTNDSGKRSDHITGDGTLEVSELEPFASWEYSLDNTNWITGSGNSFAVSGDGVKTVTVRQTDLAGNSSANSKGFSFKLDTTITLPTLTLRTDSGKPDDNITNDGTVYVSGLERGATWEYSTDFGNSWQAGVGNRLALKEDGNKTVFVKQTDNVGNTTINSAMLNFTLDTFTPTPVLSLANDTGKKEDNITSDGSILISNLENGTAWQYSINNGDSWLTGIGNGLTLKGDGNKTVIVKQTDIAGNSNASAFNFTLDSQVTKPILALANDTGKIGDSLTSDGTVNISGLETGATWQYSTDGGNEWLDGIGNHVVLQGDGNKTLAVRQTDLAGNRNSNNAILNFTLDSNVGMPSLALGKDTGDESDFITSNGTVNVSNLEKGGRWQYSLDSGLTWIAGTDGVLTLHGDGNKTVIIHQTDLADNTNINSVVLNFTLDTEVATPSLVLANDTGKIGDAITRDGTFNVLGLEKGSQWRYSSDNGKTWLQGSDDHITLTGDGHKTVLVQQTDVAGNISKRSEPLKFLLDNAVETPVLTLSADGAKHGASVSKIEKDATWEFSSNGRKWTTGTGNEVLLDNDILSVLVRQTDVAGNISNNAVFNFAPHFPTLKLVTDSGIKGDNVTNDGTIEISELETGATWQYSTDNEKTWTKGAGNFLVLHGEGVQHVIVKQINRAGELDKNSGILDFTLDTLVKIPTLTLGNDSGKKRDFITNDAKVTVDGLEKDATWQYSTDEGKTWQIGTEHRLLLHDDGIKTLLVNQTDLAGNVSKNSEILRFTLDTEIALPSLKLLTDSGDNKDDNITNNGTVIVSDLERGATWQYSTDTGNTWQTGKNDRFILSGDGNKTVLVKQTDVAGNANINYATLNFTLDRKVTPPLLALANDTGKNSDNITSDGTIIVSGIEKGATWEFSTDGKLWQIGNGDSFTLTEDGSKTVFVRQTDMVGNVSERSKLNFILDSIVKTPSLSLVTDSGKKDDFLTNDGIVTVSNLENGADWQYSTDGGITWTEGVDSRVLLSGDGNKTLLVRQTDVAGNTNLNNALLHFTLDTVVENPVLALANDTAQNGDGITSDGTITVSGIETGADWEFSFDEKNWIAGAGDNFTVSNDGNQFAVVRQIDDAGNSKISQPLVFTLDTSVPTVTQIIRNSFNLPSDSNPFVVQVNYSDLGSGIDAKTISVADISLVGIANLTVAKASIQNTTATYVINAPKGGWQSTHIGNYAVVINANEVQDLAGNGLEAFNTPIKTFAITDSHAETIPRNPDEIRYLIETDSVLTTSGQLKTPVIPQNAVGKFGTFNVDKLGHWTYSTSTPHNEFLKDNIYLETFPISTKNGAKSNVIISITGTNDLPILVDDLSKQIVSETKIGNITQNVLHGQIALQSAKGEPLVQNADKSWTDLDNTQILFELQNSETVGVDSAGHKLVKSTLKNGSALTLNTWNGSYSYVPSNSTSTAETLDEFKITADSVSLTLALNRFDLSDLDGISPDTETALANFATPDKPTGDLNHDSIADKAQGAVANIAWITYQNFKDAQENKLVSEKPIINIAVAKNEAGQDVDESAQLSHISVLPKNSASIGGDKLHNDTMQSQWDPIEFSVSAKTDAGLNDIYPERAGVQTRVIIDISRAGEKDFDGYMKYVSAQTIQSYNATGKPLITLDGEKLTTVRQAGWYDFTQRTAGGDGVRFIKNTDGIITQIEIILTDNVFGDDNPASNQITDPGMPGVKTNIPVGSEVIDEIPTPTTPPVVIEPTPPIVTEPVPPVVDENVPESTTPTTAKTLKSDTSVSALPMEFNNLMLKESLIDKTVTKTEWIDNPLLCLREWAQELLDIPEKIEHSVTTTEQVVAPLNGTGNGLDNKIEGNSANNVLSGLAGKDILTGDAGADTFLYKNVTDSLSASYDVITDFNFASGDKLDLSAIDANSMLKNKQVFNYIGTTTFNKQPAQLRFDSTTQLLQGDTNGDGKTDFAIELSGVKQFSADSLILETDS